MQPYRIMGSIVALGGLNVSMVFYFLGVNDLGSCRPVIAAPPSIDFWVCRT